MSQADTAARPRRRRRYALGLRAMMLVVLLVSVALAWKVNRAKAQMRAIAAIEKAGGLVVFDYTYSGEYPPKYGEPRAPERLRRALGDVYFREITAVVFPKTSWDEHLAALDDLDWLTGIEVHDATYVTDAGLARLARRRGLRRVLIQGTSVTDRTLAALARLPRLERLILLRNQNVTDAGLESIGRMTGLHELTVIGPAITGAGAAHLRSLVHLESLSLGGTRLDDSGLLPLTGLTALRELDLSYTLVTDAGLPALASFTDLEDLNLRGVRGLTDQGMAHLAGLKGLKRVDVSGTMITDAGLKHLHHLPALRELDLSADEVTVEGVKGLGVMPGLRVVHLQGTKLDGLATAAIAMANPAWTVNSSNAGLAPTPARQLPAEIQAGYPLTGATPFAQKDALRSGGRRSAGFPPKIGAAAASNP